LSAPPFDLVPVLLRAIRADVDHIRGDVIEIKERLGLLEGGYASLSRRVDRIDGDVERNNVRLDFPTHRPPEQDGDLASAGLQ
jgi:hypothetical protein